MKQTPVGTILCHTSKDIRWKIVKYTDISVVLCYMGGSFFSRDYFINQNVEFLLSDQISSAPNEFWMVDKSGNFNNLYEKLTIGS